MNVIPSLLTIKDCSFNEKIAVVIIDKLDTLLTSLETQLQFLKKESVKFDITNFENIGNLFKHLHKEKYKFVTVCSQELINNRYRWIKCIKFLNYSNNWERRIIKEGFSFIHPHNILGTDIANHGLLTNKRPSDQDLQDIARGVFVLKNLSKTNIGQSSVVQLGKILGIETEMENTENLIQRCINIKPEKKGGILVKITKLYQKDSLVFPSIDPTTILNIKRAKLAGVAINANYCRIINMQETIALANKNNIFIISI